MIQTMKRMFLLLLVLGGMSWGIVAQSASENQYNELTVRALTESGGMAPVATAFDTRYEGVRGNPLLFDTWKEGRLKIKGNDEVIEPIRLNINLEKQLAAVYYLNGSIGILPADRIEFLAFRTDSVAGQFIALPGNRVDPSRGADLRFYEALHEGPRFTLLKYRHKEFRKADYKGAYSTQVRYDEYVEEIQYFIRMGDAPFTKVRLRASVIEKQLAGWKVEIPADASREDLNSEKGIVALFRKLEQQ
jgi:hypothetical protein